MGNGFTIELLGDNHLGKLLINGAMYDSSVTFTGTGSLTLNEDYVNSEGLFLNAENSKSCLIVDEGVTLDIYGEECAIRINNSTPDSPLFWHPSIEKVGGDGYQFSMDGHRMFTTVDADGNRFF